MSRIAVIGSGVAGRFVRTWNLYLAFCEAAFAERHVSDVQLLLTRAYHDGTYIGDPGQSDRTTHGQQVRHTRSSA